VIIHVNRQKRERDIKEMKECKCVTIEWHLEIDGVKKMWPKDYPYPICQSSRWCTQNTSLN